MATPYCQKGSCRHKVYNGTLPPGGECSVCRSHDEYGDRQLRRKVAQGEIDIQDTCHDVLNCPSQPTVLRRKELLSSPQKKGRSRRSSSNLKNNRYVPDTTKKISGKKRKIDEATTKRKALQTIIGPSQKINISNGGQSQSSINKSRRTLGMAVNNVAKIIMPNQPDMARDIAIVASKVLSPTLLPPATSASRTARQRTPPTASRRNEIDGVRRSLSEVRTTATNIINSTPTDSKSIRQKQQEQAAIAVIGTAIAGKMQSMKARERRPYLAALCNDYSKKVVENICNIKISNNEWTNINLHAAYPGAFKPEVKKVLYRQKIPTELLEKLLEKLDEPGTLQRVAYGRKIQEILCGKDYVRLDAIKRQQKITTITANYLSSIDEEVHAAADIPVSGARCAKLEKDTFRRCTLFRGHENNCPSSKCKFTLKGTMCKRTTEELIKNITTGQIKKLSGLDDTKEVAGRDSFEKLRKLTKTYCTDGQERQQLLQEIELTEIFYLTEFAPHLSRTSEHACACLTCGFSGADGTECVQRYNHKNPCEDCVRGYRIISRLKQLHAAAVNNTTINRTPLQHSMLDDDSNDIDQCKINLDTHRSHLARHESEHEFMKEEVRNLKHDEAVATADYKNDMLPCYFREPMQKFFGKAGCKDLGFGILTKSLEEEDAMTIAFAHLISDDCLKDTQFYISGKHETHTKHLPSHIKKVCSRTDGAANLASTTMILIQCLWEYWTGAQEASLYHAPASGGKSEVDSNFGQFGDTLSTAVDHGASYWNADATVRATEVGGGVTATVFWVFMPGRIDTLKGKSPSETCPKSVLRSELQTVDKSVVLHQHSGYGTGARVVPDLSLIKVHRDGASDGVSPLSLFYNMNSDSNASGAKNKDEVLIEDTWSDVVGCCDDVWTDVLVFPLTYRFFKHFVEVMLVRAGLASMTLKAKLCRAGSNPKQNLTSKLAGKGNEEQKQKVRQSRAQRKKAKAVVEELDLRREMTDAGIHLCNNKDDTTNLCCTCRSLSKTRRDCHQAAAPSCCTFPKLNSKDRFTLMASRPGGMLAVNSHANRMASHHAIRETVSVEDGATGLEDAIFYGKGHRPKDKTPYCKPAVLVETLLALFDERPVLSADAAYERMRDMVDPDGSRKFCHSKRGEVKKYPKNSAEYRNWAGCSMCGNKPCTGCNGKLLTPMEIKSHFSILAQKKKKT